LIKRDGVLSVRDTVDYVLQACEALAEAHAVGIVHRDVKPSNLFLTRRIDGSPCLKILDFGISKAMAPVDATQPDFGMTRTQSVLGSPQYMAPEQMRSSRRVDGRTDIWAVGTIIYELLAGESPFVANTMPELFAMILTDPTPSLRAKRPEVPEGLDLAMQKCLEKEPDKRYPNVLEVARALVPFGSTPGTEIVERIGRVTANAAASVAVDAARTSSVDIPPAPATSTNPLALAKTTIDPPRDRARLLIIAAAFATLAIASGVVVTTLLARKADTSDASPSGQTAAPPTNAATVASAVEPISLPAPPTTGTAGEAPEASAAASAPTPHASAPKKTKHAGPQPPATTAAPPPATTTPPPPPTPAAQPTATSRYE